MAGIHEDQETSNKTANQYVTHDVEDQGPPPPHSPSFRASSADDGHIVSQHEQQNLVRGLGQRHIQMIAIAGAIVCGHSQCLCAMFKHRITNVEIGNWAFSRPRWLYCYRWPIRCPLGLHFRWLGGLRHSILPRRSVCPTSGDRFLCKTCRSSR